MIIADFIVKNLEEKEISAVFGFPGGMVTYLIDSLSRSNKVKAFCNYNEQGSAFAACGYSQVSGKTGVAFATSGPGFTNLITGICHAYYDSIPILFITGQVNTNEAKGDLKVRQKGFQETDVISIAKSITKYASLVNNPDKIKYELEKAFYYANNSRKGPVLLDIPIDIQRACIEEDKLDSFTIPTEKKINYISAIKTFEKNIEKSKKPVIIAGNGINLSGTKSIFQDIVKTMQIPVVTSMISIDVLAKEDELNFGFIGVYGNRIANRIISEADLVISIGSRLDIRQTGANRKVFCKNAKIIRFDIDKNELKNKTQDGEISFEADLKKFLPLLRSKIQALDPKRFDKWKSECQYYRNKLKNYDSRKPNEVIEEISSIIDDNVAITTDVGQNQVWIAQSFCNKLNQRIIFTGGHGSMGFSLPSAIGAYYATKKPVICFTGDGGFQMNIQELQFIAREKIPIKIFILNNHSLGMIRHFQEMYFESRFEMTTNDKGYTNPNFVKIAKAYGINSFKTTKNFTKIDIEKIQYILKNPLPAVIEINLDKKTYVLPKLPFNNTLDKQDPPLSKDFFQDMTV